MYLNTVDNSYMDIIVTFPQFRNCFCWNDLSIVRCVCYRWNFLCDELQHHQINKNKKSRISIIGTRLHHNWRQYFKYYGSIIKSYLLRVLPEISISDTKELTKNLIQSTRVGVMPSFEDSGARSGYIAKKFQRGMNIPNLLLTSHLNYCRGDLLSRKNLKIASIGGGPGFDIVGFVLFRNFLRMKSKSVSFSVFDYEDGWKDSINGLDNFRCIEDKSGIFSNVSFDVNYCDITNDLSASPRLLREVPDIDLFIFQFVCIENAQKLISHNFGFFISLFKLASIDSYFIFTDSSHRLWPLLWKASKETGCSFWIWISHVHTCHYSLVLKKTSPRTPINFESVKAFKLLSQFEIHGKKHVDGLEGGI